MEKKSVLILSKDMRINLSKEMRVASVLNPESPFEFDLTDVEKNDLLGIAERMSKEEDTAETFLFLLEIIRNLQLDKIKANKQAFTDELTGLPNRRAYDMLLDHDINLSKRHKKYKGPSVLYADLSLFKAINDNHGHAAGDLALQNAASWMKLGCRDSDVVARVGGDEFAVIMPDCDRTNAEVVGARIVKKFNESSFWFKEHELRLGINIGIAEYRPGETVESLTERADAIMLANKAVDPFRRGRTRSPEGP